MPNPPTPNYGLAKPLPTESMSDFTTNLNNNWDKVTAIPSPDIITGALPQTGSYNLGDRVFRTNDSSIYLLIVKDATWGWFWRPVHAAIAPWINVPSAVVNIAGWSFSVDAVNPFAISFDNRGNCYWRGVIGLTSGTLAFNTSLTVIKPLPVGMLPRQSAMYPLGHFPMTGVANESEMARIFISETGAGPTFRAQGTGTSAMQKFWLDGSVQYAVGTSQYTSI